MGISVLLDYLWIIPGIKEVGEKNNKKTDSQLSKSV